MAPMTKQRTQGGAPQAPAPVAEIPFVNAAHEHVEGPFVDDTQLIGANGIERGPFDVPSGGYMRHLVIEASFSGGTLGAGVLAPDAPWNVFERLTLADVNGSSIFELDGYAALWANIIGGYVYNNDPRAVDFDGTINGKFYLRIPIEINHFNALGCISNQNAASSYKFSYRLRPATGAGNSALFTTAPTTPPSIRVRAFLEAWTQPNEKDLGGRLQEQLPPMHGVSQYWSSNAKDFGTGQGVLPITKVGNMIRNILVIARDVNGLRSDAIFPDPVSFQWDQNQIMQESQRGHIIRLKEKLGGDVTRDTGVFCYPYAHSELGRNGDGPASLWLGTVQSSRLEVSGNIGTAGKLQVVMNDVAPVEVDPHQRWDQPSLTGYNPSQAPGGSVRVPQA